MNFEKTLYKMADMTRGRISKSQVFTDFLAYGALLLSIRTDPVHSEQRKKSFIELKSRYTDDECQVFHQTLQSLCSEVVEDVHTGCYRDHLAAPYSMIGARNSSLKQDFTPNDIAQLMAEITMEQDTKMPEKGYFTLTDPTCGSGVLLLAGAERLADLGFNPCEQLVIQAADLDIRCVHMTYLQLSLYGIPAVVIHGDSIALKEYDRWYTPMYIWAKWIWREPMPFGDGGRDSDLTLRTISEPIYGAYLSLRHGMDHANKIQ